MRAAGGMERSSFSFPFSFSSVDRGSTISGSSVVRGTTVITFCGEGDFSFWAEGFSFGGFLSNVFYRLDGAKVYLPYDGRKMMALDFKI